MRGWRGGYRQFGDDEPESQAPVIRSEDVQFDFAEGLEQPSVDVHSQPGMLSAEQMKMLMGPAVRLPPTLMVHCIVKRDKGSLSHKLFPQYTLVSSEGKVLLIATRKRTTTPSWSISTEYCVEKNSPCYLGKICANACGNCYIAYGAGHNPKKIPDSKDRVVRPELLYVTYKSPQSYKAGLTQNVVIPRVQGNGHPVVVRPNDPEKDGLEARVNKSINLIWHAELQQLTPRKPVWDPAKQVQAISFENRGRVTEASIKNQVLECPEDCHHSCFEFGRSGKDEFALSFRYPLSTFQAFAIALSSFGNKVTMETPKMPNLTDFVPFKI